MIYIYILFKVIIVSYFSFKHLHPLETVKCVEGVGGDKLATNLFVYLFEHSNF